MCIVPKTALKSNVKILFSVILVLIIVSPLKRNLTFSFDGFTDGHYEVNESQAQKEYREYTAEKTLALYSEQIENYLKEEGIGFYEVEIEYSLNEAVAEIEGVYVYIRSGYSASEVKNKLERQFGVEMTVKVGGED